MAKATFTNDQLCQAWVKQATAEPKGTRGDVVRDLMAQTGVVDNDDNYRRMYNNVTQRVKQLEGHATQPLTFPVLAPGKKGARRSDTEIAALQNILGQAAPAASESEGEAEQAPAEQG